MKTKPFFKKNGSTILTYAGGIGIVVTSVMAIKATPKALELINEAKKEKGGGLTKWEMAKVAAPIYIPTVFIGVATVSCVFGANILNERQQASLASAYALLDQTHKRYKMKVAELYGEEAAKEVRAELAKDAYEETDILEEEDSKLLFYDEHSKRYFRATNEAVLKAESGINKLLVKNGYATLNDLYDLLELPIIDHGDYLGWSSCQMFEMYWSSWISFYRTEVELEDGMECVIIDFTEPTTDFAEY